MPAVRDRANIVCTECHSRKIKCDLQTAQEGVCKHCRRSQQLCIPRQSARKRRAGKSTQPQENNSHSQIDPGSDVHFSPPSGAIVPIPEEPESSGTSARVLPLPQQTNGFRTTCTRLYYGEYSEAVLAEHSHGASSQWQDNFLKSMEINVPPRPTLLRTWADTCRTQVFHHCPVLEESDLSGSSKSILVQKAISLIGNLLRHDPAGPKLAQETYEVLKMLININYEPDRVETLKSICLISVYNGRPSNMIGMDGSWHWVGVAARQMLQMGLYRESTYASRPNAGCLRRIFWQLHNNDTFQFSCWGRPALLRRKDFDVNLPTATDFETENTASLIFIASSKLCLILRTITELQSKRQPTQPSDVTNIETSLTDWISTLPPSLHLFDAQGTRTPYSRPISELHIQYLCTIIYSSISTHLGHESSWPVSIPSLVAASCATVLYDEIAYRDESIYLPWPTGWFCLLIALPLIHYIPHAHASSPMKEATRKAELGVLHSVMKGMRDRYGDADMVIRMMRGLDRSIERRSATMAQGGEFSTLQEQPQQQPSLSLHHGNSLFPFPSTFCANMKLLDLASEPVSNQYEYTTNNFAPVQNWPMDEEALFDFTLLDLFGSDHYHHQDGDVDDLGGFMNENGGWI